MNTKPSFDTLEYFMTLRESGMPEEKAQAIVEIMKKIIHIPVHEDNKK